MSFLLLLTTLFVATSAFRYSTEFKDQVIHYPNVITQSSACLAARASATGQKTLICDPNSVLNIDQVNSLNRMLFDIQEKLNNDRTPCDRNFPRPTIAIAIVERMNFGMNDVSSDKVIDYASIFTYYIYESWKLPTHCSSEVDKIVIFYSKEDGVVYTYAGDNLKQKLTSQIIKNTAVESKVPFGAGVYEGLKYLLQRYPEILSTNKVGMFGSR